MTRPKKASADPYKRGYGNGVRAAVDALLGDLETRGTFGPDDYDEDGHSLNCIGCMLRSQEFHQLADRWQFATGIKC